jgi:uncharacterized protein (DUF1330 family)
MASAGDAVPRSLLTGKGVHVSAYVVVEVTVGDKAAFDRYGAQAIPIIKEFGGEVLAVGPWEVLFGAPEFQRGMIILFPNREAALGWYQAPAYQALLETRALAFADCRFRLLG